MEVITIESKVFKELSEKIERIAEFVFRQENNPQNTDNNIWLDSDQLSDMLGISTRTLQRLRKDNQIAYTKLRRKCIYRLSDVREAINSHIITCDPKTLDDYRKNYLLVTNTKKGGLR
ncbi:helix-turn-helix domain-containing protein [Bacteroides thetaiotaomicron]|uniref:helix-turn-helix domain-containing protein n=1 Tax=Bacteroides thetaiotaomicron TaxID=818 RepID=UPI001C8CBE5C|nr:helix-turn-helix domain-containing protein [Bacteroides thetaiotaomicron]MBX9049590.1 helix-turn-helix domain-containing protein [Bacteroides thetaiotaomicron]MBX9074240.1 helix-turn-helix domain-containing protein [Bacteroides thetaiotaomicron]